MRKKGYERKLRAAVLAMALGSSLLSGCGQTANAETVSTEAVSSESVSEETASAEAGQTEAAESDTAPEIVPETAPETTADGYAACDEVVYVLQTGVNVRTSPEIEAAGSETDNIAFLAKRGDQFHRIAYSDGFSQVEKDGSSYPADGQIYYVSSQYLSLTPPTEEESTAPSESVSGQAGSTDGAGNTGSSAAYADGQEIGLNSAWKYADYSAINSGKAVFYAAGTNRKGKIIAVNAGHGTEGGASVKTYCHPDKTPKLTGGSTQAGATMATAVSGGMTFKDGTPEKTVTLRMAQILKEKLLAAGYDVLMLRDGEDVQLDNIARTVIANNVADCHISLHWDGDGLSTIKGCFYMSVPDGLKTMEPVASHWQQHEALGDALIEGLRAEGLKIWGSNPLDTDLTQTSYSTIPSVDIELGNQNSSHSDETLTQEADGLLKGINAYFGF